MARTRSSKAAPAKSSKSSKSTESEAPGFNSKIALVAHTGESPKLFILPSKATPEARIVTLPNPRNSQPSRYLVCPETGIYEFTKIAAPKAAPRSWLIESASKATETKTDEDGAQPKVQTTMGSDLFLATAIDPLFMVLPALADSKASKGSEESKRRFLLSDDHFEKLPQENSHLAEILRWDSSRKLIEARMGAVCDTVEAGDESMFRLNDKKLMDVILEKAKRMSDNGLPASMEERFVKKVLEAPLMQKKVNVGENRPTNDSSDSQTSSHTDSATSQSTASIGETDALSISQPSTVATSFTEDSTAEEVIVSAMEASPEVMKLQRLRVAFDFICSSYVAPALAEQLQKSLGKGNTGSIDFSPLDEYLVSLEKLRSEAIASRSGNYSQKRVRDEEEDEARAEKKRKMEEEKRKKASESRAVRDLKKVNTSGMKKLSDFFKKK